MHETERRNKTINLSRKKRRQRGKLKAKRKKENDRSVLLTLDASKEPCTFAK